MMIRPGTTAVVHFDTSVGGDDTAATDIDVVVYRGDLPTSIIPNVVLEGVSHYVISFLVPLNWASYESAYVSMTSMYEGAENTCTKFAGQIDPNYLVQELAVSEQTKTDNLDGTYTVRYWLRGSGRTVLLHQQEISGDPCEGDVTIGVA